MSGRNDAEKSTRGLEGGSQPQRVLSLEVARTVQDPNQYTLKRRPWRPRVTPFSDYLARVSLRSRSISIDPVWRPSLISCPVDLQDYRGKGTEDEPFIVRCILLSMVLKQIADSRRYINPADQLGGARSR